MAKLQPIPSLNSTLVDDQKLCRNLWYNWFLQLKNYLDGSLGAGYTGVIVTARLTGLGAQGSMTFVNGILTAQTPAT